MSAVSNAVLNSPSNNHGSQFLHTQLSVTDISKKNIAMSTNNRHSKLSILENMKPKEREKYDWKERNGEDPFY